MTPGARPAPLGERARTGWGVSLLRGFLVFALVLSIGLAVALAGLGSLGSGASIGAALRIGALYLGPFHHVAVLLQGDLDVDLSRLPGSDVPAGAGVTVELGVALLAVTGLVAWLLFRAGRASATGDRAVIRAASGSRVALGYAPPIFLIALLVAFEQPARIGTFVTAGVRVSLSAWQALLFPWAIAAAAGAAGGMWSWASAFEHPAAHRVRAVLGGGWVMLLLALALSYAGLLAAGVAQPDEPVALATPSTARYYRIVFERPGVGAVLLGHQVALTPNEAMWTLVPAEGACDVVRGTQRANILCYGSFPSRSASGRIAFATAPAGFLLFLLVPAAATVAGGRWAGRRAGRAGRAGLHLAVLGGVAGVVFGVAVGVGSLLASVTLTYAASTGTHVGGRLWIGPDPVWGTLAALAWGLTGGAIGALSVRIRGSTVARRRPGSRAAR